MNMRAAYALIFVGVSILILVVPATTAVAGGDLLYVCNEGTGNISIIDLKTGMAVGSIDRPSMPYGTALSPDGSRLYVAGRYSNAISVIDTASGDLMDTVKVDSGLNLGPYIAVSPDGRSLCVMRDYGNGIKVVNTTTLNVTAKSTAGVVSRSSAAFSPDGHMLYVADTNGNRIYAIDAGTGEVTGTIAFLGYPVGVSVGPDGKHVYTAVISKSSYDRLYPTDCPTCTCLYPGFVAQTIIGWITGKRTPATNDTDAVYEMDPRDLSVEAVIPLEAAPRSFAAGPGDAVYLDCNGPYSDYLLVVDTRAKNVTDRILLGPGSSGLYWGVPGLMAASPDGSRVYLPETMDSKLLIVNMASHNVTRMNIGGHPAGISAGLTKAYVSIDGANEVLVIDPDNNTIARTLNYWWDPQNIVLSPDGSRAYALSAAGNFVTAIDAKENRIIADIPVGPGPVAMAMSPEGTKVWVACADDDTVSMIDTANNTATGTIRVGRLPGGLAFSPDGAIVYVVCREPALMGIDPYTRSVVSTGSPKNDSLYAIDARTGHINWSMDVRYFPTGVAVSPDGSRLYVTCRNETTDRTGNVRVIDTRNRSLVESIEIDKEPEGIWSSPDGSRLFVVHLFSNKLTVIDTGTGAVSTTPRLEYSMLKYLAMSRDGSRLYLSTGGFVSSDIVVIDVPNNTTCGTIKAGFSPAGMAVKTVR